MCTKHSRSSPAAQSSERNFSERGSREPLVFAASPSCASSSSLSPRFDFGIARASTVQQSSYPPTCSPTRLHARLATSTACPRCSRQKRRSLGHPFSSRTVQHQCTSRQELWHCGPSRAAPSCPTTMRSMNRQTSQREGAKEARRTAGERSLLKRGDSVNGRGRDQRIEVVQSTSAAAYRNTRNSDATRAADSQQRDRRQGLQASTAANQITSHPSVGAVAMTPRPWPRLGPPSSSPSARVSSFPLKRERSLMYRRRRSSP